MTFRRICVFCGSSPGASPVYAAAARTLGHTLAARGIGLVYGGGRVGVMGELAASVLARGGHVTGVIPRFLAERHVGFEEASELRVVESMHERKAVMADLADAFVALPGGLGTFEELFEILTWAQLDLHRKPCGLLNTGGYYDGLLSFLDHAVAQRFVEPEYRSMMLSASQPDDLLALFEQYQPPTVDKAERMLALSQRRLAVEPGTAGFD